MKVSPMIVDSSSGVFGINSTIFPPTIPFSTSSSLSLA
jgi:hypothetical protein